MEIFQVIPASPYFGDCNWCNLTEDIKLCKKKANHCLILFLLLPSCVFQQLVNFLNSSFSVKAAAEGSKLVVLRLPSTDLGSWDLWNVVWWSVILQAILTFTDSAVGSRTRVDRWILHKCAVPKV